MTHTGLVLGAIACTSVGAHGAMMFRVTEIYAGITGEDGTNDWFELYNPGPGTIDTGDLFWDDTRPNREDGGRLDSFVLAPGRSAVFIIADVATDFFDDTAQNAATDVIAQFRRVWRDFDRVGLTNGGGRLSHLGDSINISLDGGLTFPFTVSFSDRFADSGGTIQNVGGLDRSREGVNGVYRSRPFFNDLVGDADDRVTLLGSPGFVPAPGALACAGVAAACVGRRRRV